MTIEELKKLIGEQQFAVIFTALTNKIYAIFEQAGYQAMAQMGLGGVEFNKSHRPELDVLAKERAASILGRIGDAYGTKIRTDFADELSKGGSPWDIAARLAERYQDFSLGSIKRTVRSEMRQIGNLASLDSWESVGVTHVIASDGRGGLTGKTDPDCIARNGRRYTIDEARAEEHSPITHPNCTLAFRPDVTPGITRVTLPPTATLPPIEER